MRNQHEAEKDHEDQPRRLAENVNAQFHEWQERLRWVGLCKRDDVHLENQLFGVSDGRAELDIKVHQPNVREFIFEVGEEFAELMVMRRARHCKCHLFVWELREQIYVGGVADG